MLLYVLFLKRWGSICDSCALELINAEDLVSWQRQTQNNNMCSCCSWLTARQDYKPVFERVTESDVSQKVVLPLVDIPVSASARVLWVRRKSWGSKHPSQRRRWSLRTSRPPVLLRIGGRVSGDAQLTVCVSLLGGVFKRELTKQRPSCTINYKICFSSRFKEIQSWTWRRHLVAAQSLCPHCVKTMLQ